MARFQFAPSLIILLLLILNSAQSRTIKSNHEIRPLNHLELNSSIMSLKPLNSTQETCVQYYRFLPCASNIPGFIFQIVLLEYLLLVGDKILTKGRQQLFSILGVGIYGFTVFRILAVLPTIVIVLASGLAQDKEAAQIRVENGVGTIAGCTVFYLTLQWGICVLLGRRTKKITESHLEPNSTTTSCSMVTRKLFILKEYGVETDKRTSYTAKIMLLSLIPFIIVEIFSTFKSRPWSHILTLLVSVAALVSYFVFQSHHQWIQERSLEYSRNQLLLAGFLDHLQKFATKKLVNDEGQVDASCIRSAFHEIDKDKDNHISIPEFNEFLANKKSGDLELDEKFTKEELMKHFDKDSNKLITEDEFLSGCEHFISEAQNIVADKEASSRKYLPSFHKMVQPWIEKKKDKLAEIETQLSQVLNTAQNQQLACLLTDGKPDETKIRSLFDEFDKDGDKKMTVGELSGLITNKFKCLKLEHDDLVTKIMKAFDKNNDNELHEDEFTDAMKRRLSSDGTNTKFLDKYIEEQKGNIEKKSVRRIMKALIRVVIGVVIVSSLGLPLVNNTQLLSDRIGIPPFFVSFVVLPFAQNFRTVMATIFPASQKKEGAAAIMFSEIYGAVFMNNILGLMTLLGLIWARGFEWVYSAEVLVLVVISGIMGVVAFKRIIYPLWTCILAFALYPFSLLFFYIIRYPVGWK